MFKRILALAILALMPAGLAYALPDAPAKTPPYTIQSVLIDSVAKTGTPTTNSTQKLLGYTMAVHDDKYKYAVPICRESALIELDNRTTDPADYQAGDSVVINVVANPAATSGLCANRILRQTLGRGSSSGECLQNYQVKHAIQDAPNPVITHRDYVFNLTVYMRPTLECDGQTYGANPITTTIANHAPLIVTVSRPTTSGEIIELMRWDVTTSSEGKASFQYTFNLPNDKYVFKVMPGSNATPGDVISWEQPVFGPGVSPTPTPAAPASSGLKLTAAPFIGLLILVLLGASVMEALRFYNKSKEAETPEEEYKNTPKL